MTANDLLIGLLIALGLVGILVPLLPGSLLVLGAIWLWCLETGGPTAWAVGLAALVLVAVGAVVKYVVPRRRLQDAGVPGSTQWLGVALGVVGFFVVPVVGLVLGFVLGVYLAEHRRVGAAAAWPSTRAALRAVGLGMLIELGAACAAAAVWGVGVVVA